MKGIYGMKIEIIQEISNNLKLKEEIVTTILTLLASGNTVHFLARYRKEQIGGVDEEIIRKINDRYQYDVQLLERKTTVKSRIDELGMLSPQLAHSIDACLKIVQVEQLYEPYKTKKVTKAKKAIDGGLAPLADAILAFGNTPLETIATAFCNDIFPTVPEVLENVGYLIAQKVSENLNIRDGILRHHWRFALLSSTAKKKAFELDPEKIYENYYEFSQQLPKLAHHQVLALNRAEKQKIVTLKIQADEQKIQAYLESQIILKNSHPYQEFMVAVLSDALKRLILPSIHREIRTELTQAAQTQAIELFGHNVYQLLMQKPLEKQIILGFDPAFRTGCKLAVVNSVGTLSEISVIYPHMPQQKAAAAEATLLKLYQTHHFTIIAIGNGTASRESEQFIANWIQKNELPIQYTRVSEAGASVYSASKIAIDEFPTLSVEQRSAISIARRLLDPLAELVKIDPKALGVGQYQHDLSQVELSKQLGITVDNAVNNAGVDINFASAALLQYVSGLNKSTAKNIIAYRDEHGRFSQRKSLLEVKGFGKKAYEQAAGFLRIIEGKNTLDNTAIHPESYKAATGILAALGSDVTEIGSQILHDKIQEKNISPDLFNIDKYTLSGILDAFRNPLRSERDKYSAPALKQNITTLDDLYIDLELEGVVRNITDFGVFIDIGLKNDGFAHVSKLSKTFVSHPANIVSIGDIKTVYIENIHREKGKVELTLLKREVKL
ncbi:transcriptional accessory protein [Erysipelotrichaceae bacterium]|nr:transcriptional accessory protein [Erysipelotrichaceae bacterium]